MITIVFCNLEISTGMKTQLIFWCTKDLSIGGAKVDGVLSMVDGS